MFKGKYLAAAAFLATLALGQSYLDGRPVIRMAYEGRYEEAYAFARKNPAAYGQWASVLIWQKLLPHTYNYTFWEATVYGYAEACKHSTVNREAESFCLAGVIDVENRKRQGVPKIAELAQQAGLPNISEADARARLERLAEEGVPHALAYRVLENRAAGFDEGKMRAIAQQYPHSLGGVGVRGRLASWVLWPQGRYTEALEYALELAGINYASAGMVAWAEYTGTGTKRDRDNACRRALFWSTRVFSPPGLYTLGLCYLEGAGGLPKDPVEAYALFWIGSEAYKMKPFTTILKDLEAKLSPEERAEGRKRTSKYLNR